jgi:hypothetical protein
MSRPAPSQVASSTAARSSAAAYCSSATASRVSSQPRLPFAGGLRWAGEGFGRVMGGRAGRAQVGGAGAGSRGRRADARGARWGRRGGWSARRGRGRRSGCGGGGDGGVRGARGGPRRVGARRAAARARPARGRAQAAAAAAPGPRRPLTQARGAPRQRLQAQGLERGDVGLRHCRPATPAPSAGPSAMGGSYVVEKIMETPSKRGVGLGRGRGGRNFGGRWKVCRTPAAAVLFSAAGRVRAKLDVHRPLSRRLRPQTLPPPPRHSGAAPAGQRRARA